MSLSAQSVRAGIASTCTWYAANEAVAGRNAQ